MEKQVERHIFINEEEKALLIKCKGLRFFTFYHKEETSMGREYITYKMRRENVRGENRENPRNIVCRVVCVVGLSVSVCAW